MKTILTFLLFSWSLLVTAQDASTILQVPGQRKVVYVNDPIKPYYKVYVEDAKTLVWWAQHGIAAKPLLPTLYQEIVLKDAKIAWQAQIMQNGQNAQEEYRNMLTAAAIRAEEHNKQLATANAKSFEWERKAKTRGETLWAIGGSVFVIAAAAIIPKL